MLKRYPLVAFFAFAYALTWLAWLPLALRGPVYGDRLSYLHFLGSLGPLVSAFVITGLLSGRSGVRELLGRAFRWRVALGWHLVAWFSPAALYSIAAVVVRVVSGQWPLLGMFGHSEEFAQLALPVYWVLSIICYGFGEEVGWRGFALPHLQRKYSGLTSAVILSVFWAVWHLPVFAFSTGLSQMGPAEIVGWYFSLLTGSVLLTWMYNGARGSVLIVAIFHAMLNVAMTSPSSGSLSTVMGALLTLWGVYSIRTLIGLKSTRPVLLSFALCLLIGLGPVGVALADGQAPTAPSPGRFTDMAGNWAAEQVAQAADLGLVWGYPDGSFGPGRAVTRAEFLKMAVQVRGLTPRHGNGGFTDVDKHWVAGQGYLQAAVDGGLIVPTDFAAPGEPLLYQPDRAITRQEVAVVATRAMAKQGEAMALRGAPLPFSDEVPSWASGFVAVTLSSGILQGYPDDTFGGSRNLTRAEAAVVALRLLTTMVAEGSRPAPDGLALPSRRTVPVWEASSWNVSTIQLPTNPSEAPGDAQALTTAPDGTLYYFADGQIFRVGADGTATEVGQAPVLISRNGLAADNDGNVYVIEQQQVLRIAPDGSSTVWAGSEQPGFADGVGTDARFTGLVGICGDPHGNLYVTESAGRVRKLNSQGRVTTLAGMTPAQHGAIWTPWRGGGGGPEGPGYLADLGKNLSACAADGAGNVYISDGSIRRIAPDGTVSWFASNSWYSGYADGLAAEAQFRGISAMAADAWGDLWVADQGNQRIRRITPDGRVYTVAGGGFDVNKDPNGSVTSYKGGEADGLGPDARFNGPVALALSGGKLYIAESSAPVDPESAPSTAPRHLRVITGSAASYPAEKVAVPVAGVGLTPDTWGAGQAAPGPVTVAYGLYAPVEAMRLHVEGTTVTTGSEKVYTAGWDASAAAPGLHNLQLDIRLPDIGWVTGGSFPFTVRSSEDPNVHPVHYALITPARNAWVKGSVTLMAIGDGGPLEFRVDGQTLAMGSGRLLSVTWDTTTVDEGKHPFDLGHMVDGQMVYDVYGVNVINHSQPPREDDVGPGLQVFLGGKRLTYKSAPPRVVSNVAYVPFGETMDHAGVLISESGDVYTAQKGSRVTTLNATTGEYTIHDPNGPDQTGVLDPKPIREEGVLLVPSTFVADVLLTNVTWIPDYQTVWWW